MIEWRDRSDQAEMVIGREYLFWYPDPEPPENHPPDAGYAHVGTWTGRWPNGEGRHWAEINPPYGFVYTHD